MEHSLEAAFPAIRSCEASEGGLRRPGNRKGDSPKLSVTLVVAFIAGLHTSLAGTGRLQGSARTNHTSQTAVVLALVWTLSEFEVAKTCVK